MNILYPVRAGFVLQGTSLNAWCRTNGFDTAHVSKALMGEWKTGKKTQAVRALLIKESKAQL
jgi:hypothetical protein